MLGIRGYSIDNEHGPLSVLDVYDENLESHDFSPSSPARQPSSNAKGSSAATYENGNSPGGIIYDVRLQAFRMSRGVRIPTTISAHLISICVVALQDFPEASDRCRRTPYLRCQSQNGNLLVVASQYQKYLIMEKSWEIIHCCTGSETS